jgi:hypothetical protein
MHIRKLTMRQKIELQIAPAKEGTRFSFASSNPQ